MALTISGCAMLIVMVVIQLFVVPWQRKKVENCLKDQTMVKSEKGLTLTLQTTEQKKETVDLLFRSLQTLSAVFTSFSHGGNDVSNSIGPLIAIWKIYSEGSVLQKTEAPIYLLFYGGIGMVFGMWILGRRVNETVGKKITKITPTK